MCEPDMLQLHFDDLTRAFVTGVQENGGPESLSYEHMRTCFSIQFAMQCPHQGGNVPILYQIMKKEDWAKCTGRWDPVVNERFYNRNYTCAMRTNLRLWEDVGLYRRFKEWKQENKRWFPKKEPFQCPPFPL